MSSLKPIELKKLMSSEPDLVVIDIRTANEIKTGRIPKSEWIDVSDRAFIAKAAALPKDKIYCLYCASGGRTSMVVPFMEANGFSRVHDLEGGIMSWIAEGNGVE